jgi:hypothetical protein
MVPDPMERLRVVYLEELAFHPGCFTCKKCDRGLAGEGGEMTVSAGAWGGGVLASADSCLTCNGRECARVLTFEQEAVLLPSTRQSE